MFKNLLPLLLCLLAARLSAQAVNWASDVAPLLYEHCVKCHRDGGIAGFSLIGYGNAYTNRYSIGSVVSSRQMPPWKADPAYRHFAYENTLTDAEIQTIQDWVDNDAPAGNLNDAPADPVFSSGSEIGMPDHILQTPLYTMTATEDEYRCFVIPNGLSQQAFLRGMEVIPGNHQAIHHVLIYEDTTGQGMQNDLATPEPGYLEFGSSGVEGARLVGVWVPGHRPSLLPPFMGIPLTPGADLIVQVHYPPNAQGITVNTTVNLFFTPTNQGVREVAIAPLINHFPPSLQEEWLLNIPPNTVKTYHAQYTVLAQGSLIAVAPHMHLIAQSVTCFGLTPAGDTIPIIRIPDWDFHWQGFYTLQKVEKIPFLTTLHAYVTYDNTPNNDQNPSDPPQHVWIGEATTDEMLLVYFMFMIYQPGDENIVLDSTLLSTGLTAPTDPRLRALTISPNPASDRLQVQYELQEPADVEASIVDMQGRTLKIFALRRDLSPGIQREEAQIGDLPAGQYLVRIQAGGNRGPLLRRFVKN